MDMQCYVSVARELEGTGLCVMGDAVKGVWFIGYSVWYPAGARALLLGC
jgi:cleavage and polyadenylation specificity factor subunit 1